MCWEEAGTRYGHGGRGEGGKRLQRLSIDKAGQALARKGYHATSVPCCMEIYLSYLYSRQAALAYELQLQLQRTTDVWATAA